MVSLFLKLVFVVFIISCATTLANQTEEEERANSFLKDYDEKAATLLNQKSLAEWQNAINITDENSKLSVEADLKYTKFQEEAIQTMSKIDPKQIKNETILRQLKFVGEKALPDNEQKELLEIISKMGKIYGTTKIYPPGQKDGPEADVSGIMDSSTNYTERTYYWEQWRIQVGRKLKPLYERYVELKNKRAKLNGYDDYGDQWRSNYEMDNFEEAVLKLYEDMEPLYKELHAYVRRKLNNVYGDNVVDLKGKLPASILPGLWGRFWKGLYKHVVPYPKKPTIDPTEEMKKQKYTVEKMFKTGDKFYQNLGLKPLPDSFWNLSMLVKPTDGREVICHGTAWDFYDKKDFRIHMCTSENSFSDLNTIHHELGHIQYYMQYKDQPIVFREGANDGFHEAIGELMGMSGATPKHLRSINLIEKLSDDDEQDINFMMSQALITISTLPFHLVKDLWRWRVFRGEYNRDEWNNEFWKLNEKYLGVKAPVVRTKEDLDPTTIFHVCQDYSMIRYFTRTILQFQFSERLCEISNHVGPLHKCDFSESKEAGKELAKMLQLGRSVPWQDALEKLTKTSEMSARPILQFFQPLHDWLKKTNAQNGDGPGW